MVSVEKDGKIARVHPTRICTGVADMAEPTNESGATAVADPETEVSNQKAPSKVTTTNEPVDEGTTTDDASDTTTDAADPQGEPVAAAPAAPATPAKPVAKTKPTPTRVNPPKIKPVPEKVDLEKIATQGELWIKGDIEFKDAVVKAYTLLVLDKKRYLAFNVYNGTFGKKGKIPPIQAIVDGSTTDGYEIKDADKLRAKLLKDGYKKYGA
jgi:hypothetical protein